MIQCKEFVPDVYMESEDFLCVLRLLDLISNVEKNRNGYNRMRDPFLCPDDYLPLAANYVGYEYDKTIPVNDNRLIIEAFPYMKKNKGNRFGIELAIKTALALSDTYSTMDGGKATFTYSINNRTRVIDIQIKCLKYSKKLFELIEYVRPIGFSINANIASYVEVENSAIKTSSILEYIKPIEHREPFIVNNFYIDDTRNKYVYEIVLDYDGEDDVPVTEIRTKLIVNHIIDGGSVEEGDDIVITTDSVTYADGGAEYHKIDVSISSNKNIVKMEIPTDDPSYTPKELFGGVITYTIDGTSHNETIQRTLYNKDC